VDEARVDQRGRHSKDGSPHHPRADARCGKNPGPQAPGLERSYRGDVPELPEIQAHAERLSAGWAGRPLEAFRPLTFSALKMATPDPTGALGRSLGPLGRRGKFLLLPFEASSAVPDERLTFVVHLMQGGRLVPDPKQSAKPRGSVARWVFGAGTEPPAPGGADALLLTEAGTERKAGVWVVAGDPLEQAPLAELGVEADAATIGELAALLRAGNVRLHGFLRDQHQLAGLGRMLANEVCHRARLSPFATTAKLDDDEVARLHDAIGACVDDALAHERTLDAMSKSADRPGAVHRRKGATCPVCGDTVRAVEYRAYEVDYCPTCQTDGRVLADNTTSKFLK
jgi:formamidopyrimidine-DNA glycosylase